MSKRCSAVAVGGNRRRVDMVRYRNVSLKSPQPML
jgi:hypothetical protein